MPLDKSSEREYSAEELAVLGGVIDYADRMIYEDQHLDVRGGLVDPRGYARTTQAPLYRLLRKNAYAKTVVIDTELQGRILLRLSPTEVIYPNFSSGYCTPHSPQGRLASFVQPGYTNTSKLWGEYEVVEVRSFERFGGADFEPNVRNFLSMSVAGHAGDGAVTDLHAFLRGLRRRPTREVPSEEVPTTEERPAELEPVQEAETPPQVVVAEFEVVDEPDQAAPEMVDESEEDWDRDSPPVKADEYFGLSERFFTHQTEEQNQVISRSPLGPMFVEGVAGSGKTSAALGRTKMLTTFNAASVVNEQAFRDLLGPGQDYWSPEFAGQFSQESCVGFVRTGELIQYLQETCRRIDLPDLPVQEFKELQARLREHRRLTRSLVPGRRWAGVTNQAERNEVTTMAWLRATEQAIARRLAHQVLENMPTSSEVEAFFQPAERSKVARVMAPALVLLGSMLSEVAIELRDPPRDSAFALDRLAVRLANVLTEVRRRVTGPRLIWTQVGGATYHAPDENNLARQLVEARAPLYLRTGQRLVFADGNSLIDSSLQLVGLGGLPVDWDADTKDLLESGQILVRDSTGQNFKGVVFDANQLFLRLLPEASERIYSLFGGKLRPLPREHGWGRVRLQLVPAVPNTPEEEETEEEESSTESTPTDQARYSTADAVFTRLVQRRLFGPLTALPDLYLDALRGGPKHFPVPALVQETLTRIEQFKLADQDIDLLLCVAHLIGRGLKQGGVSSLREPSFYQAVFVDEVQDFTEQQVYLMVEQSNPMYRAITVVGDFAQKLHHGTTIDLRACFPGQALPNVKLTENLRQNDAPALAFFSALFRTQFFGDAPPSDDLKQRALTAGSSVARPKVLVCSHEADQDEAIINALRASKRGMTAAVLFPNSESAAATFKRLQPQLRAQLIDAELSETVNLARRHVRHFADMANAKGLEFDVVIVARVDEFNLDESLQVNRLYVGLTRARRSLTVLASRSGVPDGLSRLLDSFRTILGPDEQAR